MNELERLVQEHCPNGVEFKQISDICIISRGQVMSKDFIKENAGEYPVYSSQTENNGELGKINSYKYDGEYLTWTTDGANAGTVFYRTGKFSVTNVCGLLKVTSPLLTVKFLYYALLIEAPKHVSSGMGNPKLMSNVMGKIKIPVPPIEVQEKIIPILDNFTALTERLTSELKTELAARKKQYEYLRDMIINSARGDVKKTTMGNALTFLNGRAYKQQELLAEGKYPVLRVGNFYTNNSWYYSDLELEEDKYCDNGDLLYSWAATLGPKIWDGGKCIFHYHIWKILFDETKIDKRYLYYYLQYDLAQIASSTTKSTMIHVSMGSMKERPILIPNIDEQRRIADLISRLDVLYNSIKNELHSEIVVRQKQYEYYRSKLLSFQER